MWALHEEEKRQVWDLNNLDSYLRRNYRRHDLSQYTSSLCHSENFKEIWAEAHSLKYCHLYDVFPNFYERVLIIPHVDVFPYDKTYIEYF